MAGKNNNKDSSMAAHLVKSGLPHGRRRTSPAPNSGGSTMRRPATGSAALQRRSGQA